MLPQSTIHPIDFRDGDVLLSLGSGWTDGVMEMFDHVRPLANAGRVIPIVLVHDLIPFHPGTDNHPNWKVDAFEHWFQTVTSFVDRYLVYSRATEQDLSAELSKRGRSEARIARFALAHELPQSVSSETATVSDAVRDAASEPYALAVGQVHGRKNGDRLVAAWTLLRERVSSKRLPRLIFAGASQREDLLVKLDSEMEDKIMFLHRPSDTDLAFLYQNALLCVHPSLFEGWGLPIGEALWHRKLCIASNVSSIPEVGGEEYRLMRESEIAAAPLRSWRDSFRLLMEAATRLVD
jgi:glycosyltransferase involved in cell wall biosynthesis